MSTQSVLTKKARQAQVIFEDLVKRYGIKPIPTTFVAQPGREAQFNKSCFQANPFPGFWQLLCWPRAGPA